MAAPRASVRLAPRRPVLALVSALALAFAALTAGAGATSAADGPVVTAGSGVNLRACSHVSSTCYVIYTFRNKGTQVYPRCWLYGDSVNGDSIWYYMGYVTPNGSAAYYGYVAGYWITTGHDPNPSYARCGG